MLRLIVIAATLTLAAPAHAATSARERGVTVWRPAPPAAVPATGLEGAGARCAQPKVVIALETRQPPRRLRTHRSDGSSWETRLPLTTSGFFADRMATGL